MRPAVRRSLYLTDYWRAIRKHWIALMSGGFSLAFSLVQHLIERFIPSAPIRQEVLKYLGSPSLWIFIAFCCVLLASYLAWRDQYEIVENAKAPAVIINYKITSRRATSPVETDDFGILKWPSSAI
jgi:hypothetical protein